MPLQKLIDVFHVVLKNGLSTKLGDSTFSFIQKVAPTAFCTGPTASCFVVEIGTGIYNIDMGVSWDGGTPENPTKMDDLGVPLF